jgi:hypothetical protein
MAENSFMVQSLEAAAAAIACVADGIQRNPSEWHSALEEHLMTSIYLFIDLSIFLSFFLFFSAMLCYFVPNDFASYFGRPEANACRIAGTMKPKTCERS